MSWLATKLLMRKAADGVSYTTWNPDDKDVRIDLSEGNLRITHIAANQWGAVRSIASFNSGKVYFEYDAMPAVSYGVGIALSTASLTAAGVGAGISDLFSNGTFYVNGVSKKSGVTIAGRMMMAFDFTGATGKCWIGSNGTWAFSGDPAAGTNWITDAIPAGTYFAYITAFTANCSTIFDFGQAPTYTIPSGFTGIIA